MADNYVQRGDAIDVVAAAAMTSGVAVAVGGMVGVPQIDGAIGETVPCGVKGVYILPLLAGGSALAVGTVVNFDAATASITGEVRAVSGDINGCGVVACNGSQATDSHIEVLLTPGTGTAVA